MSAKIIFAVSIACSISIAGCIKMEKLTCADIVCPKTMSCAPNGQPVCVPAGCGDGISDPGEKCENFGAETADCNINCTPSMCGDGIVNQAAGESCDYKEQNVDLLIAACPDGARSCRLCAKNDCRWLTITENPECGNGVRENGEECDDKENNTADPESTACPNNKRSCMLCTTECKAVKHSEPIVCGDTFREGDEKCDLGDDNQDHDAALAKCGYGNVCTICNKSCEFETIIAPFCGDEKQTDAEVCDLGAKNGAEECDPGLLSCELCLSKCTEKRILALYHCDNEAASCPNGTSCLENDCIQDRDGGNKLYDPCDRDSPCVTGTVCVDTGRGRYQCLQPCEILTTACPDSRTCTLGFGLADQNGEIPAVSVCGKTGNLGINDICNSMDECPANSICKFETESRCRALCDNSHLCSDEFVCQSFTAYLNVSNIGSQLGVCLPK